jgi:putative transposase
VPAFAWTWKVRRGPTRTTYPREARDLIRKMCRENPGWGAPRIHGELLKLGIDIGESSVSRYMMRCRKPPSQTWRTFLENHAQQLISIDFFTVPTILSLAKMLSRANAIRISDHQLNPR